MQYLAKITKEGKHFLAEFPDAPGCQTFAETENALRVAAKEALEGWLESFLIEGDAPPQVEAFRGRGDAPRQFKTKTRARLSWTCFIDVDLRLAVAVQLRWARQRAGISQAVLAARAGVSQQQIAKLERPRANPSLRTLAKIAEALDERIEVAFLAINPPVKKDSRVQPLATTKVARKRGQSIIAPSSSKNASLHLRPIAATKPKRTTTRVRERFAN